MDAIEPILSLCMGIYQMAGNVKANRERCQRVTNRVRALEELVLTIKQRGPGQISAVVENALRELCSTLISAKGVLIKYSKTKGVKGFLKSSSHKDKFHELNERLSENFQVLSGALQIEQVNMLHKVYGTFTGPSQSGVDCSGWTLTGTMPPTSSPTTPMPLSGAMPLTAPMPLSGAMPPTAPMPLPGTMPPTAPMPLPGTMAPTAPMPLPGTMPPTAPMPLPGTMAPTAPMPLPGAMPPTAPMPLPGTMPPTAPMPLPGTMAPMPFSPTMAPMPFSPTMAPRPVLHIMAPCTGAPVPLATVIAQLTFPPQNNSVVGS